MDSVAPLIKTLGDAPEDLQDLKIFLCLDYSQIEIRMLAEASQDKLLIRQFQEAGRDSAWAKKHNKDIHCQVGRTLTGWELEKIANDHYTRKAVKELHFAIVFGVQEDNLHAQLKAKGVKITQSRTRQLYRAYFQKYAGVKRFIDHQRHMAETLGYVETLFGFRRDIFKEDDSRGSFWGNQAINTPIQGSAHQLVLMALALLHIKPKTYSLLQEPLMEVHDALYWRIKLRHLMSACAQAKQLLEYGVVQYAERHFSHRFSVPLVSEAKAGFCLGSMIDYTGQSPKEFLQIWVKNHIEVEAKSWEKLTPVAV